jgi:hypothetical protein
VSLIGRSTRFSVERARTQLGWTPRVGVVEGLRRTLEWHGLARTEQAVLAKQGLSIPKGFNSEARDGKILPT